MSSPSTEARASHVRRASAGLSQSQPASASTASSSPFASIRGSLSGLDDLIIANVLKLPPVPPGGTTTKEPLSIQTTSINFRRFVAKSGWIFVTQDAVEAVLRWQSAPKTIFFAVVWAFLCVYPIGFLLLPNVAITATLLYTHQARAVASSPKAEDTGNFGGGFGMGQPVEGSVDYLANLHGIQIMMGRLSDLADFGRSLLPYLTWSHEPTTLVLLQLSAVSTLVALFVYPHIPWRFVFLVVGELVFVGGHPMVMGLILGGAGKGGENGWERSAKRWQRRVEQLVEEDRWEDDVLRGDSFTVVDQFESERWADGQWTADVSVGGELPSIEFKWIPGSSWTIDDVGDWAQGRVDPSGWTYLQLDGTRTAQAQAASRVVGSGGLQGSAAQSRRRRLWRRAYVPAADV